VAIWRIWAWIVATAIYVHEVYFDLFKIEIESIASSATVGTVDWYVATIKLFQFGDSLILQGLKYVYPILDTTKQIVKRCAIEEKQDGSLRIKVAKVDSSNNLIALDTVSEVPALISYIKKIRFAGTRFTVFTNNGDYLKVFYTVYYDPIISIATLQMNVETAIVAFVTNLNFNGELLVSKLTDVIQTVTGVKDVVFVSGEASFNGVNYNSFTRLYVPDGGYFVIDPNNPLVNTITYISI
jgi:hypothetical protein